MIVATVNPGTANRYGPKDHHEAEEGTPRTTERSTNRDESMELLERQQSAATSISASYTIRKSGPSVPARPPCGQDGTRPTVVNPLATAVAVAGARALDGRRAGELSAARRAPALTELQRNDLVSTPQRSNGARRRRPMF